MAGSSQDTRMQMDTAGAPGDLFRQPTFNNMNRSQEATIHLEYVFKLCIFIHLYSTPSGNLNLIPYHPLNFLHSIKIF